MMKIITFIFLITVSTSSWASLSGAQNVYQRAGGTTTGYLKMAAELVEEGLYFTSVPFMKEYLASSGSVNNRLVDNLVDNSRFSVGRIEQNKPVAVIISSIGSTRKLDSVVDSTFQPASIQRKWCNDVMMWFPAIRSENYLMSHTHWWQVFRRDG